MDKKANIAIIILAAGSSSRMGQPKQLLPWGKSTLLNHSVLQAKNSTAGEVFVVLGANHISIKSSIEIEQASVLHNSNWEEGIGCSIAFAFQQISSKQFDGVLIMLADQPQIDTRFLNILLSNFHSSQKPIIATSYKKGIGVPAIFDKQFFEQLANLSGDKGAKQLITTFLSQTNLIAPKKPIIDIDTETMYQEAKQVLDK